MNKSEEKLLSLSIEQLSELFQKAAEIGANAGIDKYKIEIEKRKKGSRDRRLHNTKLLLRNYRALQINAESSVFGRTQMEESAADILESMMNIYNDELIVESIKTSATRTAIIVSHVRAMIDMYKIICDQSVNEIGQRRFDIIYSLYIDNVPVSRKELAEKWSISFDTTYTDEKIAIERLSALIFGVDGLI